MGQITVNGVTISGEGSIHIDGNKITIGSKTVNFDSITDSRTINVVVNGDVDRLSTMSADIEVHGNVGNAETKSGDISVSGDVSGDVEAVSGDINIGGSVSGRVKTISGDIRHR